MKQGEPRAGCDKVSSTSDKRKKIQRLNEKSEKEQSFEVF